MTYISQTPGDNLANKDALVSSIAPSWEEIATLLKQVSYFTMPEPPSTSTDDFFPLTRRFCVNMLDDPPVAVAHRFLHDTPKSVLLYIQLMQEYIAVKMAEVVRPVPSQFKFLQCMASNTCFNVVQVVVAIRNMM